MKIEKLNENKIRITLNNQDLLEKNIDFHSFMSNSKESQNLFLDMLDEAEKKVGFITKDYKLRIEALALTDGNFILTITRFRKTNDSNLKTYKNNKLKIKRKNFDVTSEQLIFKFDNFDNFCDFSKFCSKLNLSRTIAKNMTLYFYKNAYYLFLSNINLVEQDLNKLYTIITEFSTYIDNAEIVARKLNECGKIIMKNNAIKTCVNYFN
jgi:adapter protein MecA 1/2